MRHDTTIRASITNGLPKGDLDRFFYAQQNEYENMADEAFGELSRTLQDANRVMGALVGKHAGADAKNLTATFSMTGLPDIVVPGVSYKAFLEFQKYANTQAERLNSMATGIYHGKGHGK